MAVEIDPLELIPCVEENPDNLDDKSLSHSDFTPVNNMTFAEIQRKIEPPNDLDVIHASLSSPPSANHTELERRLDVPVSGACGGATIEVPNYNALATAWLVAAAASNMPQLAQLDVGDVVKPEGECCMSSAGAGAAASSVEQDSSCDDNKVLCGPLDTLSALPVCTGRETHNEKERKRRYRIKNACALLKDLIPGLSDKTDKATVLEYTVQYLVHVKRQIGRQFDRSFLHKYSPY